MTSWLKHSQYASCLSLSSNIQALFNPKKDNYSDGAAYCLQICKSCMRIPYVCYHSEAATKNNDNDKKRPESFHLSFVQVVREASKRVLGLRPFDVQLIGGMVRVSP